MITNEEQKTIEMAEIKTAKILSVEFKHLHYKRDSEKKKRPRGKALTTKERQLILDKTNSKCHICGCDLNNNNFEADHVKSHIGGGDNRIDNYLPSCKTCNNYRWHYLPEEIHWILKIGVWAKTQIEKETTIGKNIAERFVNYEASRIKRAKK